MMLAFSLIILVLILSYYYLTKNYNYWKEKGVLYEKPLFFFGNFLNVALGQEYAGKYIEKLCKKFDAPYFGFYAFNKPYLVIKDPDIIRNILVKDFNNFSNRFFVCDESIDPYMSCSLLGIKTPKWKALRSKLTPIFTPNQIRLMFPLMKECGENMENYISNVLDKNVEAKELVAKYSTDVIATCAFGINANSFIDDDSAFRIAGRLLISDSFTRYIQSMSYTFAPLLVKIFRFSFFDTKAVQFLKNVFLKTIKERELKKEHRNDLIDILINLKNQKTERDEFRFVNDRLIAQSVIFFLAGNEAVGSLISFTLHELCINPHIQEQLRNEINEMIEKHQDITYDAIHDMNFLHMVVCETLRKYPLTPYLQRECDSDYLVTKTGLVIDKGTPIIIPQHGLQWDTKYISNPEKFDPERFNAENKQEMASYVYLPFGDGPRRCIGERFGLINAKLGLTYIIRNFQVERNENTQEPLIFARAELLHARDGIHVTFRKL